MGYFKCYILLDKLSRLCFGRLSLPCVKYIDTKNILCDKCHFQDDNTCVRGQGLKDYICQVGW